MPERFEDALKALRHVARGNGLVMKIAARLESAHKREVDMAGVASAVDASDDGPSGHEGTGDYQPITIELRMLAAMSNYELNQEQFKRVCDAIDAVHASLEAENESLRRELDRVLGERDDRDGWVELPKDADGEIIHVGDMMKRGKARGHVIALMLSEYPKKWGGGLHWGVQLEGEQAPTAFDFMFHHYHEPTVEDVLREFADEMNQNLGMYTGEAIDADEWRDANAKTVEKFSAKLRLVGDDE